MTAIWGLDQHFIRTVRRLGAAVANQLTIKRARRLSRRLEIF